MAKMGFIKNNHSNIKLDKTILIPETFTHAVGIGQTGSGKTTSFIKYTCPATDSAFELRSSGYDRKWGTPDDIVVD